MEECGILLFLLPLLLLTHLLLVRAADDVDSSTQVKAGNVSAVNECYWSGEGPICDGKCRAGETVASESKKNDGNGCIIGKKMYCCKGGAVFSSNAATEPAVALHHVKRQQHVIEVTNSSWTEGQQLPVGDNTKDDCYWVGKSPNCKGSCLEGDYMVNTSRTANGSTCIVGKKKYCCKGSGTNNIFNNVHDHSSSSSTTEAPIATTTVKQMTNGNSSSCYWVGKAPICLGSCKFGDYVADKSPTGDGGEKCESGQKKFCCARQQSTAPHKTTASIGQTDNVNHSISNSTSRPFQARRRPTPRGLPINSTVTNRVKIVKIKRKLVVSTPTTENVSTSIPMSETSSTLAMASLLTLPSTTATTASTTASTTTATTTIASTTTESTTATTATTTTTTELTTATATTSSTPIPTTSTTPRSTSTATESTSPATGPSTPASSTTSIKPTPASAPKKFAPFFDLPDVLPVPLIFRIQKSANDEISPAASVTTSIIQSSTTSATPTTLE